VVAHLFSDIVATPDGLGTTRGAEVQAVEPYPRHFRTRDALPAADDRHALPGVQPGTENQLLCGEVALLMRIPHGFEQRVRNRAVVCGDDLVAMERIVAGLAPIVDPQVDMIAVLPGILHAQHRLHRRRCLPADALQCIAQDVPLQPQLLRVAHVLPLASSAAAECRAGCCHTLARWELHIQQPSASVRGMCLDQCDRHDLARQAERHKDDPSLVLAHGVSAVGHVRERDAQALNQRDHTPSFEGGSSLHGNRIGTFTPTAPERSEPSACGDRAAPVPCFDDPVCQVYTETADKRGR